MKQYVNPASSYSIEMNVQMFNDFQVNRLFSLCPKSGIRKLIHNKLFRTTVAVSLVHCAKKEDIGVNDKIKVFLIYSIIYYTIFYFIIRKLRIIN